MLTRLTPIATTLLVATAASAQSWVTYTEETGSRLQFNTVANGGSGLNVNDAQEKDMIGGDFDKDGDTDLVIVRKVPFSNPGARSNLLLMNENGVLVDRTNALAPDMLVPDDTRDVLVIDVDNDGWDDLVTATTFSDHPAIWRNLGESGGVWQGFDELPPATIPFFPIGAKFCAVYCGDVNNDGWMDLYFSDYDNNLEDQLLVNLGENGAGVWQGYANETAARIAPGLNDTIFGTGSFMCDFNLDGWDDILKISGQFQPAEMLINDKTGNFNHSQILTNTGFGGDAIYMARVGDFDNDGRMDIYFVDDGQDFILYNDATVGDAASGGGQLTTTRFTLTGSQRTDGFGGNVKAADLDGDGCVDLGVADVDVDIANCNNPNAFATLRNEFLRTGTRTFQDPDSATNFAWNTNSTHDFEFMDIDGDGFLDLFIARCTEYKVFIQDPFARAITYGEGCPGTPGVPEIGSLGMGPTLGNPSFQITLDNAQPGGLSAILGGVGQVQIPFLGCDLLVFPLFDVATGPVNAMGGVNVPVPIPNDPALEGSRSNFQFVILDPGGTLNGAAALSDGLDVYLSANFVL